MDLSNLPPNHGGPLGDAWFRGLSQPEHFLTALKDDFWILVAGCMMKYIRLEKAETGLTYIPRIVKQFNHGVDGVSAVCGNQFRDVYALAEKRAKPRIFIFQINKTDRGELEPSYMHSLKRVYSWDIRAMQFISKELFVVLTGFPSFNVVLFKWSTNEELLRSQETEPNLFSKLVINPANPCQWMEYGHEHLHVYEMPSLTRTDVIRTSVNLPKRTLKFDAPDPQMGRPLTTKIICGCWTIAGEFYILDEQCGIHQFIPEQKVLKWLCCLSETFLGADVAQIVPYSDGVAAITKDGWFLYYGEIKVGGVLEVQTAYKLSSNVIRYIHFPENPDSFFAVTESKGMIEGVSLGLLRDPFAIQDLMFANIISCCFIEPQSDYMVIVTKIGKVVVLECETGSAIAKWKLPFKVVGVASHPILPFLFVGTTYGCVNVLDVRNLKTPKLINRRFLTREPNPAITRFGFVSQGRYVISADTVNNRVFVQYGYPFMSFDFIDTAKVPANISHINVPGCGKDDNRFQVYMSGKSSSDLGVVAFIINFSLRNDRLMLIASQIVDQPVTAMCMSPMKKYLYAFYPAKKSLGVVSFCDDNQWLNLQEPEYLVENRLKGDVSFMTFHGSKLYTFSEDGLIQVHEAPIVPKKKIQLPMVLNTLNRTQTHCYSYQGIKEGIVSLDGSQVVAIGHDGTFSRVRFFAKPKEPDWQTLGYDRPKIIDYQVGTYLIDQEFYKAGEEFMDRIADIKVKIDQEDPVNFYPPGEETSDEDEVVQPAAETPKAETLGEKFKYGPRKSFKGTITRKKHVHNKPEHKQLDKVDMIQDEISSAAETTDNAESTTEQVDSQDKKRVQITAESGQEESVSGMGTETTNAEGSSFIEKTEEGGTDGKSERTPGQGTEGETSASTAAPGTTADAGEGETSLSTAPPGTAAEGEPSITIEASEPVGEDDISMSPGAPPTAVEGDGPQSLAVEKPENVDRLSIDTKKESVSTVATDRKRDGKKTARTGSAATKDESTRGSGSGSSDSKSGVFKPDKDDTLHEDLTISEGPETNTLMEPIPKLDEAQSVTESIPTGKNADDDKLKKPMEKSSKASMHSRISSRKKLKTGESSVAQKLLSKVKETTVNVEPKPVMSLASKQAAQSQEGGAEKTTTVATIKTAAPTTTALKGLLSERIRRKQMAKDKTTKTVDKKPEEDKAVVAEDAEKKPEEAQEDEEAPVKEEAQETAEESTAAETTGDESTAAESSGAKPAVKKGLKGIAEMKKAAKVLSMLFGGKKGKKKKKDDKAAGSKTKKKIKKFQGGQASKMLAEVTSAATAAKVKVPASRTARGRHGQAKLMKQIIDDDKLDPLAEDKKKKKKMRGRSAKAGKTTSKSPVMPTLSKIMAAKSKKKNVEDASEASKALMMESESSKNLEVSVLQDPAIKIIPDKEAQPYEGLDVADVLTVNHAVRRKEYTEPEFFTQFEKTLLHRWHVPKAQILRQEFARFTELMEDLMFFNKQREEGNQVELKEFNFDEDREPRLKEKAEKMKKIANIQMTVRNKLRSAKINTMKHLVWEQFETKGATLMGFRKKLEVSNYPLLQENIFYDNSPISEAISWRRLEQRLELEEKEAINEANVHALRVLQHEMQFMPPLRKRAYMKSIMAIDPNIRFDEYEASDSDQSDEEFFAKVFEELGIEIPEETTAKDGKSETSAVKSKAFGLVTAISGTSKAASKFLKKRKDKEDASKRDSTTKGEGYVERLKRMLLEQEAEEPPENYRPSTVESSVVPSENTTRAQSRRDFMVNLKPSKAYYHPRGMFGPGSASDKASSGDKEDVQVLMEPHLGSKSGTKTVNMLNAIMGSTADNQGAEDGVGVKTEAKPTKYRMVIRQKKKMKFKRMPDVVFESEEDLSAKEDEAVVVATQSKFETMDDEFKERFDTINNIFYGSSLSELVDMYQFQPAAYRYSQFDLGSRHELWRHHYIIASEIYQMKKFFNRQFELLRNAKAYSLRKMADRNDRIREIYYYLKVDLDILDEKWRILEDPSQIFTVTKEEVPVERYLTAEQRRLEELRRLEDLARRRTRMAEFRKKALYAMMDNRLEVKREEILVNDIPKPAFMLEKDPLEFTLEEYLQSLQYAEAVEALEKARIELIKELEEELGRHYRANAMEINTIDLRVYELSLMKFQFHQNFQMEETRILRAIRQLRIMEELDKEERRIAKIVIELKNSMKTSQNMAAQLENKKITCEEEIAKVAEQEKDFERNFRRDLGECGQYFEFFYKNYKKKPKLSLKGLNKADVYETMVKALRSDNIRVFARENGEIGRIVVMAIYDFEDPMLMPKDCPRSYWDKFNRVRRERLICEYQTKMLMSEIDRITEAINDCSRQEAEGTGAIAAVLGVISHKNDMKSYYVANVEFQMVLGKGQCEIDCWSFEDHINATIILIENVEKLNHKIFEASEKLIKEMTKTAGVHRDIKEIEWRFLVVEMATKDLKKVRHDVGCFKPTKKLLEVLRRGINLDTMHSDRMQLVDYLKTTYMKYQRIFLRHKKKLLRFYQRQTQARHDTNEFYRGNIFEQTENLVASQVNKLSPDFNSHKRDEAFEQRTVQLMLRGYLNRKVIKLCNEVERLEEELEKQYQRTYPVL